MSLTGAYAKTDAQAQDSSKQTRPRLWKSSLKSSRDQDSSLEKHNPAFMPFMLNNSVAKMICGSVKLYLDLNFYLTSMKHCILSIYSSRPILYCNSAPQVITSDKLHVLQITLVLLVLLTCIQCKMTWHTSLVCVTSWTRKAVPEKLQNISAVSINYLCSFAVPVGWATGRASGL